MPVKQSLRNSSARPCLEPESQTISQDVSATRVAHQRMLNAFNHDLRGPISVILGFIQLLEWAVGGELTDKQRELIDHIRCEAVSLNAVADRIQQYANGGF